ncbi:DUF4279 domain-containing protein [Streptomyces olivoreticuli]
MSAFRMYIRVVSDSLTPEEITVRLDVEPDVAHAIGSRRRPESPQRSHTTWVREAKAAMDNPRPENLEPVVLQWGDRFASALEQLSNSGEAEVSLVIVQRVRDIESSDEKGIFFGVGLITWLARARAALDIDQYILHDFE